MSRNIISKKERKKEKSESSPSQPESDRARQRKPCDFMVSCGRNRRQRRRTSANALACVSRCAPPDFRSSFLFSVTYFSCSEFPAPSLQSRLHSIRRCVGALLGLFVVVALLVSLFFSTLWFGFAKTANPVHTAPTSLTSNTGVSATARRVYLILFMDSPSAVHKVQFLYSYSN